MPEKECKYPDCFYYTPKAKKYCCMGCSCDHTDYIRLGFDKRDKEK